MTLFVRFLYLVLGVVVGLVVATHWPLPAPPRDYGRSMCSIGTYNCDVYVRYPSPLPATPPRCPTGEFLVEIDHGRFTCGGKELDGNSWLRKHHPNAQ